MKSFLCICEDHWFHFKYNWIADENHWKWSKLVLKKKKNEFEGFWRKKGDDIKGQTMITLDQI